MLLSPDVRFVGQVLGALLFFGGSLWVAQVPEIPNAWALLPLAGGLALMLACGESRE